MKEDSLLARWGVPCKHHEGNRREEIVCSPRPLRSTAAECYMTAVQLAQPDAATLLESVPNSCFVATLDSAKSNLRFVYEYMQNLPAHTLCLVFPCFHHQDALVLEPLTRQLDLLAPLFCVVRQLQKGEVIKGILDQVSPKCY